MTGRVRHDGAWARKALGKHQQDGWHLANSSVILATVGIRTPVGRYDGQTHTIVFPWIEGVSACDLFRPYFRPRSRWPWAEVPAHLWVGVLRPLVYLHRVETQGLNLAPLDPWRRILPRLQDGVGTQYTDVATEPWDIYRLLREARTTVEARTLSRRVVVHGDYHVGQVLFESPHSEPWLLDLDDLAVGLAESDLGNFAAHLATFAGPRGIGVFDVFDTFEGLLASVNKVYTDTASTPVDAVLVRFFGAVALLRRALKRMEQGAGMQSIQPILSAARTLGLASK